MISAPLLLALTASLAVSPVWPDLGRPAATSGGGAGDAALIVGIEDYVFVPDVPGAVQNANDWHVWLTATRKVPLDRVVLLRNEQATIEEIEHHARAMAGKVRAGGTLWFVFIGHGAPARSQDDGILVGVDAQQTARGLFARSMAQRELLGWLSKGARHKTVVLLDACFSGRTGTGAPLAQGLQPLLLVKSTTQQPQGMAIFTAAKGSQFAGPLPGAARPAFSYLMLGALRGWGDGDQNGRVTVDEAYRYTSGALASLIRGRTQEPQLAAANAAAVLTAKARESGPDLGAIVRRSGGTTAARTPSPAPEVKSELQFKRRQFTARAPVEVDAPAGPAARSLQDINLEAERLLEAALELQNADATPPQLEGAWCSLARIRQSNPYLAQAKRACSQWKEYVEKTRDARAALERDFKTLSGYLELKRPSREQKVAVVQAFLKAYGELGDDRVRTARAWLVEHDIPAAEKLVEQALDYYFGTHSILGGMVYPRSAVEQALDYYFGTQGTELSIERSIELLEPACEQNQVVACRWLAHARDAVRTGDPDLMTCRSGKASACYDWGQRLLIGDQITRTLPTPAAAARAFALGCTFGSSESCDAARRLGASR